jgi:hypothetical protein
MLSDGTAAGSFVSSANVVLLVVSIIASAVAIVSLLGGLAVVFGGSWRKSEMEMLRASREDLTSINAEQQVKMANLMIEMAAKDQRVTELTALATARQPFEQITVALTKHQTETAEVHAKILDVVERIASRLGEKSG